MKAIVHIGTEKTGTTSIQEFLYQNRKKLRSAGFHFIQSAGQRNNRVLPAYCIGDNQPDDFFRQKGFNTVEQRNEFKRDFIKEFEAEIHSVPASIHTFIISSEHFHSRIRSEAEMENVYRLLSTYFDEFKIICYLREQSATCSSGYSTHMKTAGTESLDTFLLRCKPVNYFYNYHELLANWERCFGFEALDVSIFAQDRFVNGDLFDDFTAKINPALVGTLNKPNGAENESLKPIGQALARAVNITFPVRSERPEAHELRDRCKKVINDAFTGKGLQPKLSTRKLIYEYFAESNERVRQKFFPHIENLFPPPAEITQESYTITEDDFQGIASVFNVLKKYGKGAMLDQEYATVCSTIFSCIDDVTKVVTDEDVPRVVIAEDVPPVVIDEDVTRVVTDDSEGYSQMKFDQFDAMLLIFAAGKIRGRAPKTAFGLAALALRMFPDSPGISEKMEEFRQRSERAPKPQFIITYQPADSSFDRDQVKQDELQSWLSTLEVPEGRYLIGLGDSSIIYSASEAAEKCKLPRLGFSIFEAESMDEALLIARKCPLLELGMTLEVSEFATG